MTNIQSDFDRVVYASIGISNTRDDNSNGYMLVFLYSHIRYRVRLWDDETNSYIEDDETGLVVVDTSCIRREKNGVHSINQDKSKMFLKYHCEQVDGIWRVKVLPIVM